MPECIHSYVIVKKPIVIRPNISKLKNFFKAVLSWMCIAFSFVFFNLNHIRYWFKFKSNPSKMKKEVEEVKLIMNRLDLKKSGKVCSALYMHLCYIFSGLLLTMISIITHSKCNSSRGFGDLCTRIVWP